MAQIEAWLWDRLKTDADILAALGGPKVFPLLAPQFGATPYITFSRAGTERNYTTLRQDGLPRVTFDVNCWDRSYANLQTWKQHVRESLDGVQETSGAFQVRFTRITDEFDDLFALDSGAEVGVFVTRFLVEVRHTETVVDNIA